MERVLGQEGLAELGVAQLAVVVLVEARHEERHLVIADMQAQLFQTLDHVLHASRARARLVEDPESVDEVEVSFETELNLDLLYVVFEL